jgi:hypothetical protein
MTTLETPKIDNRGKKRGEWKNTPEYLEILQEGWDNLPKTKQEFEIFLYARSVCLQLNILTKEQLKFRKEQKEMNGLIESVI